MFSKYGCTSLILYSRGAGWYCHVFCPFHGSIPPEAVFCLDSGGEFKLELIDIENLEFYTVTS